MNTRERFHAIMAFEPFDRLPILEWATWWNKTIDRWHGEGLPKDITDRYHICHYFKQDVYKQDWISIYSPDCPKPRSHGAGIIKDEKDYEEILPYLYPKKPIDEKKWTQWAEEQSKGDVVLWFSVDGFFWFARSILGIEQHLFAFYDQPELMHRINTDLSNWIMLVIAELSKICSPDFMTFGEDMSYNNGPMLSEEMFSEFMLPYYEKVIPALKSKGIIPIIDSDGDIAIPAHWFHKAGLEGILPLEKQAGVNINNLRNTHPNMKFIGQFDKMTMNKGEQAMRNEFERLLPTASQGGYLISCDHQTPPGVSFQDYKIYMKLFHEYALKAGNNSKLINAPQRQIEFSAKAN